MIVCHLSLCFQLTRHFGLAETKAAELAGMMVANCDKMVREWKKVFFENNGVIPESEQGRYQRSGIVWSNDKLNKKATVYIHKNASVKRQLNLTTGKFCQWVNDDLLMRTTLEPEFPRKIGIETSRKWVHELGFAVVQKQKGTFVDSHERDDVVRYCTKFLRRIVALGFLNANNAPTEDAWNSMPSDSETPDESVVEKMVVIFHDESTLQANDDQPSLWAQPETAVIKG